MLYKPHICVNRPSRVNSLQLIDLFSFDSDTKLSTNMNIWLLAGLVMLTWLVVVKLYLKGCSSEPLTLGFISSV